MLPVKSLGALPCSLFLWSLHLNLKWMQPFLAPSLGRNILLWLKLENPHLFFRFDDLSFPTGKFWLVLMGISSWWAPKNTEVILNIKAKPCEAAPLCCWGGDDLEDVSDAGVLGPSKKPQAHYRRLTACVLVISVYSLLPAMRNNLFQMGKINFLHDGLAWQAKPLIYTWGRLEEVQNTYISEAELDVIFTVWYVLCSLKDSSNFSGVKFS